MSKTIVPYTIIALLLLLYFVVNAAYIGMTTTPSEGDSLAYHIPIAQSVLDGRITNPVHIPNSLGFYPGSSELLLAIFMALHIPLNLYNVVGWIIVGYVLLRLGRAYTLTIDESVLFAFAAMTPLAMLRLLNNQTIDIWLAVFFTASLLLLRTPKKSLSYFFSLGITFGLLIGSKFSGPIYGILLLVLMGKPLAKIVDFQRLMAFLLPFLLFGISWYLRNVIIMGNPLYPQSFLMFPGDTHFTLMQWVGWKTLVHTPGGLFMTVWSLFSEYMLWSLTPFIALGVLLSSRFYRRKVVKDVYLLLLLCIMTFLLYFFLPSVPENIITYLRYLFPAYISGILALFIYFRKHLHRFYPLIIMNASLLLTLTDHRPKVFLLYGILAGILILKYDILHKYLQKL